MAKEICSLMNNKSFAKIRPCSQRIRTRVNGMLKIEASANEHIADTIKRVIKLIKTLIIIQPLNNEKILIQRHQQHKIYNLSLQKQERYQEKRRRNKSPYESLL